MPTLKFSAGPNGNVQSAKLIKAVRVDYFDTEQTGLGLRVSPTGDRSWQFWYSFERKKRHMVIGRPATLGLAEARELVRSLRAKVAAGIDPAAEVPDDGKPKTFTALAALYIRKRARLYDKGRGRRRNKADVVRQKVRMLQTYVKLAKVEKGVLLGTKAPADITKRDIQMVIDAITERGTLRQADAVLVMLRTLFRWAYSKDFVAHVPTNGIEKSQTSPVIGERVLSESELIGFLAWIDTAPIAQQTRRVLKLLILTGARTEEMIELPKCELDLENEKDGPLWLLPAERSKSNKDVTRPLAPMAVKLLREAMDAYPESAYVFPGENDRRDVPYTDGVARKAISRGLDAGKLTHMVTEGGKRVAKPIAHFTPHDFRRTVVTLMAEKLDVDEGLLGRTLGHSLKGITGKVYNKSKLIKQMRNAYERWAAYVEGNGAIADNVIPLHAARA